MDKIVELFHLDLRTVAIALINIVLIVVILYFLVFRKVKKLMTERKAKAEAEAKENQRLIQEAADTKQKYEKLMKEADEKIAADEAQAGKEASVKAQAVVDDAKKQASAIIAAAKKETEAERHRMERDFKEQLAAAAVDMAAKVLEREVSRQDNSKILDDCLNKWNS
jgi:F-type H+-transporting ATPase subunit b